MALIHRCSISTVIMQLITARLDTGQLQLQPDYENLGNVSLYRIIFLLQHDESTK